MSTVVVTGFSPMGEVQYGRRFCDTFDRHWPKDVRLLCFTEKATEVPRGGLRSLWSCRGAQEFQRRHQGSPAANGREVNPMWRPKHVAAGYHFKFDAAKFSKQCFIPHGAAEELADGDVMAWLDGDVVTHSDVPPGFVSGLLGDADVCHLGRVSTHTELGFWAVRLHHKTRTFLEHFANMYRTDEVFKLTEWHSAFVFDHVRRLHEAAGEIRVRNLTPKGTGHVWFQSPLARYTDHLKGDQRKAAGRSVERAR